MGGTGYGGREEGEVEELEEVWILFHGLSETSRNMEHLAEKMLENGHNGEEIYAMTFDSIYPGLEDGAEQLNEMIEEVKDHTTAKSVNLMGCRMGGNIPIQYMHE